MDFKTCKPLAQSLQPKTCQHTQSLLPTAPNILQLRRSPSPLPTTRKGLKAPFLHIGTKTTLFCCCWFFLLIIPWAKPRVCHLVPSSKWQSLYISIYTVYIHLYCIYPYIQQVTWLLASCSHCTDLLGCIYWATKFTANWQQSPWFN